MKFLVGTKEGMTQIYDDAGEINPVTVVSFGPLKVTQIKTVDKDGYSAVQVGFGSKSEKRISKPMRGHIKELGNFSGLTELRTNGQNEEAVGDTIEGQFSKGDIVNVRAVSKGKGFQGVVKRHGFSGGRRTHGQKHSEREPGSIGAGGVQRVLKGTKMGGRMGGNKVMVKNLKIVHIDSDIGKIYLKGAVPGRRGSVVRIYSAKLGDK